MENTGRGKYLAKNTVIFTIGNLGTKLIHFFLVPLYTNVLTTADYGIVDLVSTIGMVLAPVLLMNVNDGIMRFSLDKKADHNKIMSIGLMAMSICLVVGILIFPISSFLPETNDKAAYIYFYTVTYAGNLLFFGYLRGKELLLEFSIGNIFHSALVAGLNILFLVILDMGIGGYFAAYAIANLISCVYAFIIGNVWTVIKNFSIDKKLLCSIIRYSIVLIPNTFMWWIINSSDRIMLTKFVGPAANGIFAISYKIPTLLSTIVTIFNTAWSYSALRENESLDRDAYNNGIFNGLAMLSIIIGAGMMLIMKPFMSIYVSPEYYEAWKYTPYLIIGCVILSLASFLGSYYTVHKDSKGMLCSSTIAAICNLILNYILINCIGIAGAAIATAISYIIVFIWRAFDTRKYIKIKIVSRIHIAGFLCLLIMGASMFIPGLLCYAVMLCVFCVLLIIYRCTWISYLVSLRNMVYKKIKKHRS